MKSASYEYGNRNEEGRTMKLMKLLIKIKACDIDRESTMGKENNTVCSNRMKIQNTNMITEEVVNMTTVEYILVFKIVKTAPLTVCLQHACL
jgi:hypothetical protein